MIKKLQKLKAKKGFTLVELIVVIAIIGVLAAILIPTMIGYVRNANITSADQTAASIRKTITNTISSMETKGCTLKGSGTVLISQIANTDGANAKFTIVNADAPTAGEDTFTTMATGSDLKVSGKKATGANWTAKEMANAWRDALANDLKECKAGTAIIVIKNGVCTQVAYSAADLNTMTLDTTTTAGVAQITPNTFKADGNDDGIIGGDIVGTNPKVTKDAASAS